MSISKIKHFQHKIIRIQDFQKLQDLTWNSTLLNFENLNYYNSCHGDMASAIFSTVVQGSWDLRCHHHEGGHRFRDHQAAAPADPLRERERERIPYFRKLDSSKRFQAHVFERDFKHSIFGRNFKHMFSSVISSTRFPSAISSTRYSSAISSTCCQVQFQAWDYNEGIRSGGCLGICSWGCLEFHSWPFCSPRASTVGP